MSAAAVLVVAGWDPSGAAGLAQDLKVLSELGLHGCGVPAALTAQGHGGVARVEGVEPSLLRQQLMALLQEQPIKAVKLGLLYGAAQAAVLDECLALKPGLPLVLDPVLSASAGGALVREDLLPVLKAKLLPRTTVLTPNLLEASALTGLPLAAKRQDLPKLAYALLDLGPQAILLKGGHLGGAQSPDFYLDREREAWLEAPRVATKNSRGTGCALASAIAAGLAQGQALEAAVASAWAYVGEAIRRAPGLGAGSGPLDHGWPIRGR